MGASGVDKQRVVLEFDELVNVKDAFSKVVISPTSATVPRVSSSGRKVYINFSDTLQPNTTYTVDFGDAIEDNNEGNKLQGFSYTFSTGEELDTLQISGMVLAAENLEPQQQMIVGVHPANAPDSAFRTLPLVRIAKTDDRGRFTIRGLKPGNYMLYALADANNDYRWDNPQEDIAFSPFSVFPTAEQVQVRDTIYNLQTGAIDTVIDRMRTRFLPNDVLLNSFNTNFRQQYLVKNERLDSTRISLIFNAPQPALPAISLLTPHSVDDWFVTERNAANDTITLWITDPALLATDTLSLALGYQAHDKQLNLTDRIDTLSFITRRPRPHKEKQSRKKSKKDSIEAAQPVFLDVKFAGGTNIDVNTPVILEFGQPLKDIDTLAFHLEVMKDTLWVPVDRSPRPVPLDSLSLRRYRIDYPWQYGAKYRLTADTIAARGIYGNFTKPLTQEMNVKKIEDYFDLRFRISSLPDSIPAFVQLLNSSDDPVRQATVVNGVAFFKDVPLGTYYARLVEDFNGNGLYDTGDYDTRREPEYVFYYPKALKMTKRWDLDQPWNIIETPLDMQKPNAIKKNKPAQSKNRRPDQNDQETEEEEPFDPNRNPFDPNYKSRKKSTVGSY